MHANEENHWWFSGKRALFRRLLDARLGAGGLDILDVGCGTGATAVEFSRFGRVTALDRSPDALAFARTRHDGALVASEADRLPFANACFDLVLAFDIVEHVDDDLAMLADLARVVRPGGAVAIHVPAWPSLWSAHDVALEHKRRYTRSALRELILTSGLTIETLTWSSMTILPAAFAIRLARRLMPRRPDESNADMFALPAPLNAAMLAVYRAEAELAARTSLPFGLSLAAIATRSRAR